MKVIVNATVVTPHGLINDGTVWIEQGRIVCCGAARELPPPPADAELVDAEGLYVAPGFVDIHCHGGGGHWSYENPAAFARFHLKYGTTSILPTFSYNETEEQIIEGLRKVLQAQADIEAYGRAIAGIHMEGPYINPKYGAITSPIRPVNPAEYRKILDMAGEQIKVWTLAPELEGQQLFMEEASRHGIAFSVGHSEAAAETVLDSVRHGLRIGCHCTNASGTTPSPSRYAGTREVGVDEAVLLSDDIYAEVIADREGRHVRPLMLQFILKAKGVDKVIIITDAMDGTGTKDASVDVNLIEKNEFSPPQEADYMLGGSLLTMDRAAYNMKVHTGADIVDLFKMAALNPAKVIGIDHETGSVEAGKRANLLFVTEDIQIRKVFLDGEVVHIYNR
ncbi:N-acetylglucosamine-6-phosphate deacetylase [Cohnella soli]|uniref:N-acetylglucosamine-6-phosphate deacetylase n=1 Tax=Cohnella soli TaxID=425005 RepID=A0ABW0HJ85_9BACL